MAGFSTPDISASLMRVDANAQALRTPATEHVSEEDKATLRGKAKEFESFVLYQTLELMKSEIEGEFTGGQAEQTFRHFLNEHIADNVADAGGIGVADVVYTELLKNQEARNASLAAARAAGEAYSGVAN